MHKDNGLPIALPQFPNIKYVQELFISSVAPNDDVFSEVLDPNIARMMISMHISLSIDEERSIWALSSNGKFSFAFA